VANPGQNLIEKGNLDKPLILFNRTKKRADDLSATLGSDKTKVVDNINDAAKEADIIFMCLGDDAAVDAAVDKILEEDVKGKVIVDCSTVHPDTTNGLEKRITAKGGEFVGLPGKLFAASIIHERLTSPQYLAPLPWPTTASLSAYCQGPKPQLRRSSRIRRASWAGPMWILPGSLQVMRRC
jgi:hypothetical protein